ncbi:hypothetical protein [Sporosarcina sp. FSL K6-5500]|uniref:hypothetical protein n=1 Tax=Sporosarcina sp. FSL K6-5500 TaxID=2921558 RepID=UPI0030F9633C
MSEEIKTIKAGNNRLNESIKMVVEKEYNQAVEGTPDYAFKIEAAWTLVNLMRMRFVVEIEIDTDNSAVCTLFRKSNDGESVFSTMAAEGATAQLAICSAFLKLRDELIQSI